MKENSIGDRIEEKYTRYINWETDILELTIEEAIFILEKDASVHYVEDLLQEAYKVILSDYKRVLKENEELKEYKKIAELTKISCCTAQNCEALNNAIKSELENQKLKEKLNDINQKWIQKVKDKIEEYKNMLKTCNKAKDIDRIKAINERILELQELLEGRK